MAISMLKIRRPLGRLIFNMGIAIPGKTVFLIETAPWTSAIMPLIMRDKRFLVYEKRILTTCTNYELGNKVINRHMFIYILIFFITTRTMMWQWTGSLDGYWQTKCIVAEAGVMIVFGAKISDSDPICRDAAWAQKCWDVVNGGGLFQRCIH